MSKFDIVVELMVKNGVTTKFSENLFKNLVNDEPIIELDFSEHDKVFEDKIAELEKRIQELDTIDAIRIDEKRELKQRIAELENKEAEVCKNEPKISDSTPSMEWYDNRHQSDCIEISRLNTTIDVLIHKVEYLRQFAGLE